MNLSTFTENEIYPDNYFDPWTVPGLLFLDSRVVAKGLQVTKSIG